ncbi:HAD family hydrolase [Brevirhabdus pacifica]|uniref:HAD family hydrolase n=1 Tax=Brevirhabdus pacifica TaxID=1267768 RepID=A0A1U7DJI3_9RHOB|nr:HAD-IA family hydrolase [Brevirhabdus pacifica]APX90167.1 HAD family hydrolase [Brevirhabdus pacifica]OWU78772.1 HAD family hydrolase [Loktanella sp. 22II-4b]PJJ80593.1 phosphoglycolate phosphatase [Brevirhabdus pacifica]
MSRLRLVIFDVDGTLIDSQTHIIGAMRRAFDSAGRICPDDERIRSIVGLSLPEAMAELDPDCDPHALAEAYRASFVAVREAGQEDVLSPLYPGARAALDLLSQDAACLLGVATGKSRRGLTRVFEAHSLGDYFITSQVADDHPSKPHPSMIEAALRETGAAPEDTVIVGDTSFDMDMGRAAGVRRIGVSWGYHPAERLRGAGAEHVLPGFGDLAAALDEIWSER